MLLNWLPYVWEKYRWNYRFLAVCGVDEGAVSEGEDTQGPIACQQIQRPDVKVVDMRRHLSTEPSEYSYFRADALEMWAGPSHWKIKPHKGAVCLVLSVSLAPCPLCLLGGGEYKAVEMIPCFSWCHVLLVLDTTFHVQALICTDLPYAILSRISSVMFKYLSLYDWQRVSKGNYIQ
jgi:hypothetical protein